MRNLLAPIAIFYGLVLRIRHWLYDTGLIASYRPSVLTICVGNLEFGGTGKTPHSIYLIEKLISQGQRPGFVSRGYGRLTKGLKTVDLDSTANQVGDEPLLIKNKFPEIPVVVCESREEGILYLERVHPNLSVLILDDAFQHRRVSPHYSILLTNGEQPYWKNKLFPWGSLRDIPQSEKRANMVITTRIKTKTQSYVRGKAWVIESEQKIGKPICKSLKKPEKAIERWLVFCGIAKPGQFIDSVKQVSQIPMEVKTFRDHHLYSQEDLNNLVSLSKEQDAVLLTTEKDWMRIQENPLWSSFSVFVLPMEVRINDEEVLWKEIREVQKRM